MTWQDRLGAAGLRFAQTLVTSLPPRSIGGLAWIAGSLWWIRDARRRERIRQNLRAAFGDRIQGRAGRRMARQLFRNMIRVLVEMFWFERLLGTRRQVERHCTLHGDWPSPAAGPPPVPGDATVFFEGHLGNWEVICPVARYFIGPMRPVARRIAVPAVDDLATRSRGGADRVIPKHGAYRDLVRSVREGWSVVIVGDQNAGRHALWVPFFGLPASTYETPARLALREGLPLDLVACIRRSGRAFHFDVYRERLLDPGCRNATPQAVQALTETAHARLEHWVRRTPEQYNFLHRRWKDRPASEPECAYVPQYDHRRKPDASGS